MDKKTHKEFKSLALSISKILSKNKGNVSKTREDLVAESIVRYNRISEKKAESSLKRHGNGIRTARSISEFQDTLIKIIYEFIVQNVYSPEDQRILIKYA